MIERGSYRLEVGPNGQRATLTSPAGEHWATLSLLAAFDTAAAVDETLELSPPRVEGDAIHVERRSTLWERAGMTLVCGEESIEVRTWVAGRGELADVHLLGGRSLLAGGSALGF
ncbi:MAG TPA: hypothetical protein VGJ77_17290, partial [Gaiellaceae bacterium]